MFDWFVVYLFACGVGCGMFRLSLLLLPSSSFAFVLCPWLLFCCGCRCPVFWVGVRVVSGVFGVVLVLVLVLVLVSVLVLVVTARTPLAIKPSLRNTRGAYKM